MGAVHGAVHNRERTVARKLRVQLVLVVTHWQLGILLRVRQNLRGGGGGGRDQLTWRHAGTVLHVQSKTLSNAAAHLQYARNVHVVVNLAAKEAHGFVLQVVVRGDAAKGVGLQAKVVVVHFHTAALNQFPERVFNLRRRQTDELCAPRARRAVSCARRPHGESAPARTGTG